MFDVSLHLCSVTSSIPSIPYHSSGACPYRAPIQAGENLAAELWQSWKCYTVHCIGKGLKHPNAGTACCTVALVPGLGLILVRVTPAWQREALGHWGSPGACQGPVLLLQDLAHTSELECAEMAHSELLCL